MMNRVGFGGEVSEVMRSGCPVQFKMSLLNSILDPMKAHVNSFRALNLGGAIGEVVLGDTHPDTLYSMNNLAVLYESKFKYDLAEPLYKDCLEKRKAVLGDTHLDTLTSINNLAELYRSQGKYDRAEPLHKDCLKKRKAVLGDTHPDTLNSMNNLARLYDRAEPLNKDCPEKLVDC